MKNKSSFRKSCLIGIFIAVLLSFVLMAAVVFLRGAQRVQKIAHMPPSVLVYAPAPGESIQAGDTMLAYASAAAKNPIARLEFWLDGVLMDTQTPAPMPGDGTTFSASYPLQIEVGLHIFSVRAVDEQGLVGQSLPIPLVGKPGLTVIEISAEDGQTLETIAETSGTDEGLLREINPDLGEGVLPVGTVVILPTPGSDQPGGLGPIIIPSAPLPVAPTGVNMLTIAGPVIDLGTLVPVLLAAQPKAPNPLKAGVENCRVRLLWMDNADNEAYFHVWMQALGGPPKVIATLTGSPHTGPAWYEFQSPWAGIYSFWVEAVNALGAQPSEIVWVGINDLSCDPGVATHLNIETVDMFVNGGYNSVYCYLSVEGAPEKRIPTDDSQFVPVAGGWGDISNWNGGGNRFLLPEPLDGEVTLEGTCLGWQGSSGPDNLGIFKTSAPKETWDGRRQELKGNGFTIGYRIQPHGPAQANGSFTFVDYSLPLPFQPWVTTETSSNPLENDKLARRPTVHWNWNGDTSKLTGFTILMDGTPIKTVTHVFAGKTGPWEESVILPTSCGGAFKFEVHAQSGEAISAPSMPYEYQQMPCATYAEVKFETITFGCLDDGDIPVIPFVPMDCESGSFGRSDTIEATYWIAVHGEMVSISPGDMTTQIEYSFYDLGANSPQKNQYTSYDTFLVPIDALNPTIWFGLNLKDTDPWYDADDHICAISKDVSMPYSDWETYDHIFELVCESRDGVGFVDIHVRGYPSPDGSRSANPGIGSPLGP